MKKKTSHSNTRVFNKSADQKLTPIVDEGKDNRINDYISIYNSWQFWSFRFFFRVSNSGTSEGKSKNMKIT